MGCGGKDLESSPLAPRLAPCRTCTFRGVDIGTSPLYALKTAGSHRGGPATVGAFWPGFGPNPMEKRLGPTQGSQRCREITSWPSATINYHSGAASPLLRPGDNAQRRRCDNLTLIGGTSAFELDVWVGL
jgi:hypothetical protein